MITVPDELIALGVLAGTIMSIVGAIAMLRRPIRKLRDLSKDIAQLMEDWNGKPAREDASGAIIEESTPGVPALLEILRSQVQNDHTNSNLREDMDEIRAEVQAGREQTAALASKLDQHIAIAKVAEERQERTAQEVTRIRAHLEPGT